MTRLLHYLVSALAGFLLIPFMGFAQDIHFDLVTRSKDDNNNPVRGITQDKQGYLWFGTIGGLFKYDGYQYTNFQNQPLSPNSIASSNIECLAADKDGDIWIGHFLGNAGLERLDPATGIFTHFRHQPNDPSSLASDSVLVIIQGRDGTIWVGTNGGLDRFDSKTNKFFHYQFNANDPASLSSNQVRTVYEDKQGTIWVGTGNPFRNENPGNEGGFNKLDKKTGKFTRYMHSDKDPQSLIDSRVTSIFEDSHGNFWVGTVGDGLHKMNRTKGTFERLTNDPSHPEKISRSPVHESFSFFTDHITFITEDIKGRIWIGSMIGGINIYDPSTQKNTLYGTGQNGKQKLDDNNFWKAYKTADGIIWICSWESNLYKINPYENKPAHTYIGKAVINFTEDNAHNLMLATTKGLLFKDSSGKDGLLRIDEDSTSIKSFILYIEKDKDNRLWLGTFKGLYNFDPGTKNLKVYHPEKGNTTSLASDTVGAIKKINDQLWLGTAGGLVLMDTKTGTFKNYQHDPKDSNSISSNDVYAIFADKNGTVWAGGNRGINRLDQQTGHFKKYFTQLNVNCIVEDSKGVVWVAAQAGVFKYDKKTDNFLPFSDETGQLNTSTNVNWITEDHEQNLWINSSKGVIKLGKDGKEAILFGKNQGVDPHTLFGIPYTRQNGEMLFGDSSGYFTFTSAILPQKTLPPFLNITSFSLANVPVTASANGTLNKPIEETKEIHLTHDQNTFSFEFTNIDFINAHEDTRLLYMLQNYDNAWQLANSNQAAYYFNLPPGEYILKVKALVNNGSKTEKEILIIITPPWWKTWWAYCIYGLLLIAAVWATHHYQKQRIIRMERERTQKIELAQAKEIEKAYTELKQTQTQLIQSEKMASLGELTAGIAHEIQNPLNFVNNFSEVNTELINEMQQEMDKGNYDDAKTISNDIKENEQKINHHGKRADAIVKGMLQHSRTSNGIKEPTNINALADEYLRLSYHGLRAKDKSFNATLKTDFDESIGNINVIPQDIGRVILNIITNAFYAVNEKQKQQPLNYEPTVSVGTKKNGDKVLVSVKDNGNGIPQKILDKIFQPFFTTKPTGQGTGLGLSLAYDIVKAHGGEIKIETKEGEGSEFIIQLPIV